MTRHKSEDGRTKREVVEDRLLKYSPHIRAFLPGDPAIENYKNGSFGLSNCAFALYANGFNPRGESRRLFGLIYEDGKSMFSIGYFRKESDPEHSDGYVMLTCPTGIRVMDSVRMLTDAIFRDPEISCKGVYVRFLDADSYSQLLAAGFSPI
ncbi:hypothetical protein HZC07_03710, partial [Candidatus Micrarchaeota archaeon]|nr:hypothetical protein [Candidatus Micrarchaeota archaeon]